MMDGKKESKDVAMETIALLNSQKKEVETMLFKNNNYEERRSLERLIDSIERCKEDLRRNICSGNHRM